MMKLLLLNVFTASVVAVSVVTDKPENEDPTLDLSTSQMSKAQSEQNSVFVNSELKAILVGANCESMGGSRLWLFEKHPNHSFTPQHDLIFKNLDFENLTHTGNFVSRSVQVMGEPELTRIKILDTPTQIREQFLVDIYKKNMKILIIVFDVCDHKFSYSQAEDYLKMYDWNDKVTLLIGHQSKPKRAHKWEEGKHFADDWGIMYFEHSVERGNEIDKALQEAAHAVLHPPSDSIMGEENPCFSMSEKLDCSIM